MDTQFHKNFPFGKGMWIWEIWECVGKPHADQVTSQDIQKLIDWCKTYNISYTIIKCGDGVNTWDQWTPELIKAFHDNGIKIYAWSYVYGDAPLREAAIAMWALDMGADGYVFDAEEEYQGKAESAKVMLEAVRAHAPDAFLAYAPFPIIDYHESYPYLEFGKYCNAVMPQMYFGDLKVSPLEMVNWTAEQFAKWEAQWKQGGFGDSIKPIIPLGQTYDNLDIKVNYEQTGQDVADFIQATKPYFSVSFWSYQHIYKQEVWDAIKNNNVDTRPTQQEQIITTQTDQIDKPNTAEVKPDIPVIQPPAQPEAQAAPTPPSPTLPEAEKPSVSQDGGTGSTGGTGTPTPPIAPEPVKPETTKIWGLNSNNSIHSKPSGKKHIDYLVDFIILILKTLHLI